MTLYFTIITLTIIFTLFSLLTYFGLIFKHSKFRGMLKSELFSFIIKRITFALFSLFLIIVIVFLLTEMIQVNNLNVNKSIIKSLIDYFYNKIKA